ncbi:MAG: 4Fe-4S dicluster domain-containing protein [Candidatus Eremiobacteraeota bacterium]|nr:4Fe-4S dicluster domain-containing protein [Candidatus Eremiobacteraeota bacterium]
MKTVIGYKQGRFPFYLQPVIITRPEDANQLLFSPLSSQNLVKFIITAEKPVAVLVKGCDLRSLVDLLQENQIDRSDVYIIGVTCHGIIKEQALENDERFPLSDIKQVKEENGKIRVITFMDTYDMPDEALMDKCRSCTVHVPYIYDHLIGEGTPETPPKPPEYPGIDEIEKMSPVEKRKFWLDMFSRCIRCNACRQVCPLCYCNECIMDENMPRWVTGEVSPVENLFSQLVRIYHSAGRCTSCGECERACPVGIPLSLLYNKVAKDVNELFGYNPGIDPEVPPAMLTFKLDDPEVESCLGGNYR